MTSVVDAPLNPNKQTNQSSRINFQITPNLCQQTAGQLYLLGTCICYFWHTASKKMAYLY